MPGPLPIEEDAAARRKVYVDSQVAVSVAPKTDENVILLPSGSIRSQVEGASGQVHEQTLVDDAQLGHPTHRIQPTETVYVHP